MAKRLWIVALLALGLGLGSAPVRADAVQALRDFVSGAPAGEAEFRQTVTSPDGTRVRRSSGHFAFQRPNRFRFDYEQPYQQHIVADGQRVWVHDPELEQVTVRSSPQALGETPAALLAGASIDDGFVLAALPERDGLRWVRATPRTTGGGFQWMQVGFAGPSPAVIELLDAFGQRTELRFSAFRILPALAPERFRFTPPPGTSVLEQ